VTNIGTSDGTLLIVVMLYKKKNVGGEWGDGSKPEMGNGLQKKRKILAGKDVGSFLGGARKEGTKKEEGRWLKLKKK